MNPAQIYLTIGEQSFVVVECHKEIGGVSGGNWVSVQEDHYRILARNVTTGAMITLRNCLYEVDAGGNYCITSGSLVADTSSLL